MNITFANRTITYTDRATGVTLDTETGNAPPKRGDGVAFLEVEGRWRVAEVEKQRGGAVVKVERQ